MDIVDIWVNLVTEAGAEQFLGQEENAHIPGYLGSSGTSGIGTESMLALMDELGVATGILTTGLDRTVVDGPELLVDPVLTLTRSKEV